MVSMMAILFTCGGTDWKKLETDTGVASAEEFQVTYHDVHSGRGACCHDGVLHGDVLHTSFHDHRSALKV